MVVLIAYVPETCRAKETSINYIVASSWHFTLFRDEDVRSNDQKGILFHSQAFFQDLIQLLLGTYLFFLSQDIVGVILTEIKE